MYVSNEAIEWLHMAGFTLKVYYISTTKMPLKAYGETLKKGQHEQSDKYKKGDDACAIAEDLKKILDTSELVKPMIIKEKFQAAIKKSQLNTSRDDSFGHIFANILLALTGVGFIAQVVNKCAAGSFGFFFKKQTTRQDYADNIIESLNKLPE